MPSTVRPRSARWPWVVCVLVLAGTGLPAGASSVYLSPGAVRALPIEGQAGCGPRCSDAWRALQSASRETPAPPNVSDQNESTGNLVLAKALVATRLDDEVRRSEVVQLLRQVVGTERGARALAVGRKLPAYVIAADLVELERVAPAFDRTVFRPWLRAFEHTDLDGRTLRSCHEDRPNNWGTHCGAARLAVAAYLDDRGELDEAARVFRGWLGERDRYADFRFRSGALSWMHDPGCPVLDPACRPRPINPPGAVIAGRSVDGVIVDDQQRAGRFHWPPEYTVYSYGALEGAVLQAAILARFGFDAWGWGDEALRRAVTWLFSAEDGKPTWDTCDDSNKQYILDLVDTAYGTGFVDRRGCARTPSRPGRNLAWTSWTHAAG